MAKMLPALAGAFLCCFVARPEAAEIKVLASTAVISVMTELGPRFEQASGDKLVITYDTTQSLKKQIDAGAEFDVTILTRPIADGLTKDGKLAAATTVDLASAGIGVAVRAGAPKPDISTSAAFKQTLMAAKSVAYTTQGVSGQYFAGLLDQLGIADAVKAKSKTLPGGAVAEFVAKGDAELAVQQISELMPVKGIEVVGPLPPGLQSLTVFSAGVSADAKEPAAARTLLQFLTAPAAKPVYAAKGLQPG